MRKSVLLSLIVVAIAAVLAFNFLKTGARPAETKPGADTSTTELPGDVKALLGNNSAKSKPAPTLTPEEAEDLANAKIQFASTDPDERAEAFSSLSFFQHPDKLELVRKALSDNSADVRRAAIEALEPETNADAFQLAVRGLKDEDPDVRDAAEIILGNSESEELTGALASEMADPTPAMSEAVFGLAEEKPDAVAVPVLAAGVKSKQKPVRMKAIDELRGRATHASMDALIEGLNDPDKEVRESATEALDFFVSQEFTSYQEAKKWWNDHRAQYDEKLFDKY